MGTPSGRQLRRITWFQDGVRAIGSVLSPKPPDAYLCPLCMTFYTSEHLHAGELTDEHVPPRALGGKPLVLTCQSCNNRSSVRLDEFMANEEKERTFGTPYTVGPLPGSVTVAGVCNYGSIRFDGETFEILADPGQNNPAMFAAHAEARDRMGAGSSMTLTSFVRRNARRAGIGWMRAAYLAAFAVQGYRYVLQPAFEPLRAAIADPDDNGFEPVVIKGHNAGSLDPLIVELIEPAWLNECPAVFFGPRIITLPPHAAPEDWFARLEERLTTAFPFEAAVESVIDEAFPGHPMYRSDGNGRRGPEARSVTGSRSQIGDRVPQPDR